MARKPNAKPPAPAVDDVEVPEDQPVVVDLNAKPNGADPGEHAADAPPVAGDDEGVESLREQLERANAERKRDQDRIRELETRNNQQTTQLVDSEQQVLENALKVANGERDALKAKIRSAKEAGDYDAEIEAVDEMQQINIKITRINEGKNELERRAEDRKHAPADPVEQYAASLPPKSAAWVRSHPETATDQTLNAKLVWAHRQALADGLTYESDDYFAFVDQQMGFDDGGEVEVVTPPPPPPRRQSAPAAPPSRDGGGNGSLRANQIRLSPQQREAARIAGISDAEYAQNLRDIERENQTTH